MKQRQTTDNHAANAITCEQDMTNADRYRGSAAALVQAGLVAWDQLPGQPGCATKTAASFLPDGQPMPRMYCRPWSLVPGSRRVQRLSADRYEVLVAVSEEEQKRRHADLLTKFAEANAARENKARGELLKRNLVTTPAEYRHRNLAGARAFLIALRNSFFGGYNGGFGIDPTSLQAFDAATERLLVTVGSLAITYDAAAHMQALRVIGVDDDSQVQVHALAAGGPSRGTLRLVRSHGGHDANQG